MNSRIRLSLTKIFFLFFVLTIIFILILSTAILYFNSRMARNQNLLLAVATIENSRFKMSSARSKFLARQQSILIAHNLDELAKVQPRQIIEKSFIEGQEKLTSATTEIPEASREIQDLKKLYQVFLKNDETLFMLTQSSLQEQNKLTSLKQDVDTKIGSIRDQAEGISGILTYQYRKNVRQLSDYLQDKNLMQNVDKRNQFKTTVISLMASNAADAKNVSEKISVDIAELAALMRVLAEEGNSDALNSLKDNTLLQLIQLIQEELKQLHDLLQNNPQLYTSYLSMSDQFNLIINQLVEGQSSVYYLRKTLNDLQSQIQMTLMNIQQNVTDISTQYDHLDKIITKLKDASLHTSQQLILINRIIMFSLTLGILVSMIIAGYIILRAISGSMNTLSSAMQKIAKLEGGLKLRLSMTPYSDLNEVVTTFNMMAESMQYTQEHLHELVALRTSELENVNQNLEKMVNELNEAKKSSEAASKAKSEFIANISHELRTPLNAILGYYELLKEDAEADGLDNYVEDLNKINSAARHLLTLINDILDLSKIEAGKMDIFLEDVEVTQMLEDLNNIVLPLLEKNKNSFKCEIDPGVGIMHTDLVKVRQCLLNVLSNASKFTKEGSITLSVKPLKAEHNEFVLFAISDTGIGLTPEQLSTLFQAFSQAESSTSRRFGGTGLGLYLTKRFCEMLGGKVTVDSEYNKGSTFSLIFPVISKVGIEKSAIGKSSEIKDEGKPTAKTILVVDDDPKIHELMQKAMEEKGIRVIHAFHGEECLFLARKYQPDLITLDVIMPMMDGWATLSALKSEASLAHIPVILCSILLEDDLGFALGAVDYLHKPIEPKILLEKIEHILPEGSIKSVLIVDDEEDARIIMRRAVKKSGWEIQEAKNGIEALQVLSQHSPSVILLDLMMPEMDGFTVIQELQKNKKWSQIPIIVVTAKELSKEERDFLNSSSKIILQKGSYSHQQLIAAITNQIQQITKNR